MIENEILIAENIEVDMETLATATEQGFIPGLARWKILEVLIAALDSNDREKLEAYKNQ